MTDFDKTTKQASLAIKHEDLDEWWDTKIRIEMYAKAFTAGRNSAKDSLEILARAFLSKSQCFCHALFNKPCDHCNVIAAVTKAGNWPLPSGEKGKGEENGN